VSYSRGSELVECRGHRNLVDEVAVGRSAIEPGSTVEYLFTAIML